MPDNTDEKPLCYYVMNSGVVDEQNAVFEKPSPGMLCHFKPLSVRAKVDGMPMKFFFLDGGAVVNLMHYVLFKRMGKCGNNLRTHNMVLSNYEGETSNILGVFQVE